MNDDLDWSFGQMAFVTNYRAKERSEAASVELSFGVFCFLFCITVSLRPQCFLLVIIRQAGLELGYFMFQRGDNDTTFVSAFLDHHIFPILRCRP